MNTELLNAIAKDFKGKIGYGSDLAPVELVKTGISQLDEAIGGIPRGRIIEIFGPEGSGKTALALQLARALGGPVLYGDADCGLSPYILQGHSFGADMYLLRVNTLQKALEACRTAASGFSSVVLDTVTAYPTNEDILSSFDISRGYGGCPTSRVMAHAVPVLSPLLYENRCTLIVVCQTRCKPGVVFGNPEYSTGGRTLAHFASLRLNIWTQEQIRIDTRGGKREVLGQKMCVKVAKCKYGPPWATALIPLVF